MLSLNPGLLFSGDTIEAASSSSAGREALFGARIPGFQWGGD